MKKQNVTEFCFFLLQYVDFSEKTIRAFARDNFWIPSKIKIII